MIGSAAARRPRVAAAAVSLALGVFAAESATHAVHELADPGHAAHCRVLAAAEHEPSDAPAPAPAVLDGLAPARWLVQANPVSLRTDPARRAPRERAPPPASH
jgi:hypothetical protein